MYSVAKYPTESDILLVRLGTLWVHVEPATNPPTRAMYIVAEELPWAISIKRYNVITCQDVLDAIFKALREPIKRDEFFAANPKKRHQITKISLTVNRCTVIYLIPIHVTNKCSTHLLGGGGPC